MFSKIRDFVHKEKDFILSKFGGIEGGIATYALLFILASNVFIMLNLSAVKLAFSYLFNYFGVYSLFATCYFLLFVVVWVFRKRVMHVIKSIIAHSIAKK